MTVHRFEPPVVNDHNLLWTILSAQVEQNLALKRGDQTRANLARHIAKERTQHALRRFADINGWTHATPDPFTVHRIAERGLHANARKLKGHWNPFPGGFVGAYYHDAFDHARYFRQPNSPVAIAAQPYAAPEVTRALLDEAAADLGLAIHTPPGGIYASFHVPGSTTLFVLTRPGTTAQWLPEQQQPCGFDECMKVEDELRAARLAKEVA
jgi:hypothetical protein